MSKNTGQSAARRSRRASRYKLTTNMGNKLNKSKNKK